MGLIKGTEFNNGSHSQNNALNQCCDAKKPANGVTFEFPQPQFFNAKSRSPVNEDIM